MARTIISPEKTDQLLVWAGGTARKRARGPGAGRLRSARRTCLKRARRAAPPVSAAGAAARRVGPVEAPVLPPPEVPWLRSTSEGDKRLPSVGLPGPIVCPPVAAGMSSQYWLFALTVESEHGAPGWLDAAAGTDCRSSASATVNMQSVTRTSEGAS